MDGYIRSLNKEFLDILAKERLVTDLQISHIKLKLAENDFLAR